MERDLWRAVLIRAFLDARGRPLPGERTVYFRRVRASVARWVWCRDFGAVCLLAGVRLEVARRAFLRALSAGGRLETAPDARYDGLADDVVDAVGGTVLDEPAYLGDLRRLGHRSLERVERDLDAVVR